MSVIRGTQAGLPAITATAASATPITGTQNAARAIGSTASTTDTNQSITGTLSAHPVEA